MRVVCVGYREWALAIYDKLAATTNHQFLIFRSQEQYDEKSLRDFSPDIILFYGWSWIIPLPIISDFSCIMLHPSPLPRYRGGSPIQNQIIRGENESAVTLFLMEEKIDSGPILAQKSFSLEGGISDIFTRISQVGYELTYDLVGGKMKPVSQNTRKVSTFSRRKPADSEITPEELRLKPAKYLYDKIRMLQPPYPSAFINTVDGKRLVITEAHVENCSDDKL